MSIHLDIHQVLHYSDDPARVISEAARVLRSDGILIVVDFSPHNLEVLREEHAHRRLGFTDNEISKDANRTISEIFERDGERVFRQAEARTIKRLLQGPPCVVSSGGGAFMSKENRDIISKFGVSILLKVDPEILWERVRRKSNRPLLKTTNPKKELFKILNERKVSYNLADFNVESGKKNTTQQTSQKVIDTLKNRPDVLNPLGN